MLGTRVQIVHRPNLSDADPTKVPAKPGYTIVDPPMIYLEKCGELWMERQEARQKILGTRYTLQTLPSGYILYERVRPSNANHVSMNEGLCILKAHYKSRLTGFSTATHQENTSTVLTTSTHTSNTFSSMTV